jgi:hypothetical protein
VPPLYPFCRVQASRHYLRPLLGLSELISIVALELVALSQVGPIQMARKPHGERLPVMRYLNGREPVKTGSAV